MRARVLFMLVVAALAPGCGKRTDTPSASQPAASRPARTAARQLKRSELSEAERRAPEHSGLRRVAAASRQRYAGRARQKPPRGIDPAVMPIRHKEPAVNPRPIFYGRCANRREDLWASNLPRAPKGRGGVGEHRSHVLMAGIELVAHMPGNGLI